jgi:hypothetical protein
MLTPGVSALGESLRLMELMVMLGITAHRNHQVRWRTAAELQP